VKLKKKNLAVFFAITILALFILPFFSFLKTPTHIALKYPLYVVKFFQQEVKAFFMFHVNMQENKRLKVQQNKLIHRIIMLRELEAENNRLKDLLDFTQRQKGEFIYARVITRDSSNLVSSLLIDKGTLSGIKDGMPVVNNLGLVGRVTQAGVFTSRVVLINDTRLFVPAIIQRSRIQGLVSGRLDGNLAMNYIEKDSDIALKDVVVTSGLVESEAKSIYPKGIPIGAIVQIVQESKGGMLTVYIKPFIDINSLEEVLIIK